MANVSLPPGKPSAQKSAAAIDNSVTETNSSLTNKYSIAKQAAEKETYNNDNKTSAGDLRNYHNFRMDGTTPKSYFMSAGDFLFSSSLQLDSNHNNSHIQPLILNEYQPLLWKDLRWAIMDGIYDFGESLIKSAPFGELGMKFLEKSGAKGAIAREYVNTQIKRISENPESLYGSNGRNKSLGDDSTFAENPMALVRKLFERGRWLNTYEIPYFGNTYLEAQNKDKWRIGGLDSQIKSGLSKILKNDLNMDFPTSPQFQAGTMGNNGYTDIQTEFYLINKDSAWLERNFKFLHAFYAGSQWLQLAGGIITGANVYNVLCPGRFNLIWAALSSTITFEGKLRKNIEVSRKLRKKARSITDDMLWPDAWKVKIVIKDLTPNNFNTYMNYYAHGYDNTVEVLSSLKNNTGLDTLKDIARSAKEYYESLVRKRWNKALMNKEFIYGYSS